MPNTYKVSFDLIDDYEKIEDEPMVLEDLVYEVDNTLSFGNGIRYENLKVEKVD